MFSGHQKRKSSLRVYALVLICILAALLLYNILNGLFTKPKPKESLSPAYAENLSIVEGSLSEHRALYDELVALKIPSSEVYGLTNAINRLFDFKQAKPEDKYRICLTPEKTINKFVYRNGPFDTYVAIRTTGNAYSTYKDTVYINKIATAKTFTIKSSLFQAIADGNEEGTLATLFADIFSWDIDFFLYPQPGDKIRVLYEKYQKDGKLVKYGRILAAEYLGKEKTFSAFLYTSGDKHRYYDPQGKPLQKAFLKMPLQFGKISSQYSLNRYHPLLGIRRPHLGTDYASYYNAPVQATGEGRVVFSGWQGGYGNLVVIRHPNGYETYYGHNARNLVYQGQIIAQGQTIAHVGSTGLSTGPHVHYEVRKNGFPMNPGTINTVTLASLTGTELKQFQQLYTKQASILEESANGPLVKKHPKDYLPGYLLTVEDNVVKVVFRNFLNMVNKIFSFA